MEFVKEPPAGAYGEAPEGAETRGFDWAGLRARFAAAHAVRRELSRESGLPARSGSFAQRSALPLAVGNSYPDVNRTGLADGKDQAGMSQAIAGEHHAGGRG